MNGSEAVPLMSYVSHKKWLRIQSRIVKKAQWPYMRNLRLEINCSDP
jgi:hypothetical protein